MPQTVTKSKTVSLATQSLSDELFYCLVDSQRNVVLVPKPALQKSLDRHYAELRLRDQQPPMNNLAPGGRALGFLPGRDQSPGTSQGSQGSATGGTPKRAAREPERAALKSGAFTVDQPGGRLTGGAAEKPGTMNQWRNPSLDQEPDEDIGLGEKVGEVDPPGEGMMYRLEPQPDGMVAIILCADDGDEDFNTNDRTYRHRLSDAADPILVRMNKINRHRSTKDWASTKQVTLYRYKGLLPGERIALEGPNEYGRYDLILYSRTSPLLAGDVPPATGNRQEPNAGSHWPTQAWIPTPGRAERDIHELDGQVSTGDRAMTEPQMLRAQNLANAAFWARRSA